MTFYYFRCAMLNKKPLQTIALLGVMILFFSFSIENKPVNYKAKSKAEKNAERSLISGKPTAKNYWEQYVYSNYLCLGDSSLSYDAFYNGLKGYYALKEEGVLKQERILTIVDFTQHSSKERMYVINVETFEIIKKSRSEERRVGKECRSRWWAYN